MVNLKFISTILIAGPLSAISIDASAQSSTPALQPAPTSQNAAPQHLHPAPITAPVKALETQVKKSKVERAVEPVPTKATIIGSDNVYGRTIQAATKSLEAPTKFIFQKYKDTTQTPVFYSADALKSK